MIKDVELFALDNTRPFFPFVISFYKNNLLLSLTNLMEERHVLEILFMDFSIVLTY